MKKGFTLIELLLVIGIISLLSSMFFFNMTEAKKKGEDAKMALESDQVKKAILVYRESNNDFVPSSTIAGFEYTKFYGEDSEHYVDAMEKLVPTYLSQVPESPDGESYYYAVSSDRRNAVFAANTNYQTSGGSDGICKTVGDEYNSDSCDEILDDDALTVSCSVSDTDVQIGENVTFTANPSGGSGDSNNYYYAWIKEGDSFSSSRIAVGSFSTTGIQTPYVIFGDHTLPGHPFVNGICPDITVNPSGHSQN
jgi:prepilin-type N-terminal cleavage/methylation domain-containing protein